MSKIKITLAHKSKSQPPFSFFIDVTSRPIGKKWSEQLKKALTKNLQIEKNFCWVGFPDNPRQLDFLCQMLNKYVDVINRFSRAGGWKPEFYEIKDYFSPELVVKDGDVNHDLMNSIHHHFEILQGQVWNISKWFTSANDDVRFAIRQLNNLCHEIEILIKAKKMKSENPERVSPATIVSMINAERFPLADEDYDNFTLDRGFGKVFMHYCQTGKIHWEAFVDGDQDIDRSNINGLRYYSSEFNIEWGPDYDDSLNWWVDKKNAYKKWLLDHDYNPNDKFLSHGWLQVGQVDLEDLYSKIGSKQRSVIHQYLSNYLDIQEIEVMDSSGSTKNTYSPVNTEELDYGLDAQLASLKSAYKTFCKNSMPQNFCIAPFTSMRQNAYGDMSPCAFGAGEWKIGHLSVKDRFLSEEYGQLRQQFLEGGKPKECYRCWNEEDIGKKSMRQLLLEMHQDSFELVESGNWKNGPVTTVWKTSNVCNLACKTCGGEESSSYKAESDYLEKEFGITNSRYNVKSKPRHVPIEDADQYVEFSENLKFAEFFGGEPLLNKTHVHFLKRLIEKNRSRNIELYYSTNATNFPSDELVQIWSHFKALKLGLSIDGTHKGFTYMRWPGEFGTVQNHVEKYTTQIKKILNDNGTQFFINGTMTTSNLNIYNTEDAYAWLVENVNPSCYISLVQEPVHQAAYNLPLAARAKVKEKLQNSKYAREFESLWQFMESRPFDEKLWNYFVNHTERQDRFRNFKMSEAFPEFWEIIKNDYEKEIGRQL